MRSRLRNRNQNGGIDMFSVRTSLRMMYYACVVQCSVAGTGIRTEFLDLTVRTRIRIQTIGTRNLCLYFTTAISNDMRANDNGYILLIIDMEGELPQTFVLRVSLSDQKE